MVFTVHHVNIYIAQYGSSIRCYALKKNVYGVTVLVRQKHMYHHLPSVVGLFPDTSVVDLETKKRVYTLCMPFLLWLVP
jgi:hypothetical protein